MKMNGWVTSALVVIGTAIGFLVGRTTSGPAGGEAGGEALASEGRGPMTGKSHRIADRGIGGRRERDGGAGRSAAATFRQAARELERSPMTTMDFDAMFQFYDAIRWMSVSEIEEALAEMETLGVSRQLKMSMAMMLINQWAKQDGRGAVEFARKSEDQMTKTMGVMGGIMAWVKHDPEGAYAWYQENQESLSKGGMMAGQMDGLILAALAQRDMKRAFEALQGLGKQGQAMALTMMGSQMMMDPLRREEFVREIEALEDADLRRRGLEGLIQVWAFQDPSGAADFIQSRDDWEGELKADLRSQLASSWANVDAEAALAWRLENLAPDEDPAEAAEFGFTQWMAQDPDAAEAWLRAQPAEVRSDNLYRQAAHQLQSREQFEEAAEWAGRIESREFRDAVLLQIYSSWKSGDAEAAERWVGGLDEATRESVLGGGAVPSQPLEEVPAAPIKE